MSDKKAYEAYRVRQFSGPHPALQAATESATILHPSTLQPMTEEKGGLFSMHNGSEQQRLSATPPATSSADHLGVQLPADGYRVIAHFDVDAFYSQVEEVRNPSLRGRPLAVTQKYLVVTCNYPARQAGVTKLMNIGDAKRACPGLVLVPGEDLTPYRHASRDIRAVLSRWGPTEKLGLDECWVDLTQEVNLRLSSSSSSSCVPPLTAWPCSLVTASVSLTSDSKHRPQDLRAMAETATATSPPATATVAAAGAAPAATATAAPPAAAATTAVAMAYAGSHLQNYQSAAKDTTEDQDISQNTAAVADPAKPHAVAGSVISDGGHAGDSDRAAAAAAAATPIWQCRLYHGCCIAAEMKAAVAAETQYRCSAGVAFNKLLSKLVSGLHKPNGQTAITPAAAAAFLAPLPVRALPGVGYKGETALKAWGVVTVADVRGLAREKLVQLLGDKTGIWLYLACRGVDSSPVTASGPPKTLSVEDSFKGCSSWTGVANVLQVLVPDLLERIAEDVAEFGAQRRPTTLSIKWRKAGQGWARNSASTPWPITHNKTLAMLALNPTMTQKPRSIHPPADEAVYQTQNPSIQGPGGLNPDVASPEHVEFITAAALRVLKQQLQGSFCLTLLNIGVTGYKDGSAVAGVGGIQQYFQAAAVAIGVGSRGSSGGTAVAAAAAGSSDRTEADAVQISQASTAARRDYNSMQCFQKSSEACIHSLGRISDRHVSQGQQNPTAAAPADTPKLLTKRQERQLLEQGVIRNASAAMQQQQQSSHLVSKSQQIIETTAAAASEGYVWGSRQLDQPSIKRPRLDGVWERSLQQQQQKQPNKQVQQQQLPSAAQQDPMQQIAVCEVEKHHQQQQQPALVGAADNFHAAAAAAAGGCTSQAEPLSCGVSHLDGDVDAAAASNLTEFNIHSLGDWGLVSCEVVEEYNLHEDQCELHSDLRDIVSDKQCEVLGDTEHEVIQVVHTHMTQGMAV